MDPINAFQVAAAVIGLVDFGARLLSDSYEIYQSASGHTARDVELTTLSDDLSELSKQVQSHLQDASRVPSASESTLRSLSARCIEASLKLQAAINDLQACKPGTRKISTAANSFASALKAVWKKSEIEALKEDLLEIRSQMILASLISVWEETGKDGQRHGDLKARLDQISEKLDRQDNKGRLFAKELTEMTVVDDSSHLNRKNAELVKILWGIDWKSWLAVQSGGLFEYPQTDKASGNDLPISLKILNSLSFSEMDARQESIPEAYRSTFKWIFQDEQSDADGQTMEWPSFPKWLHTKDDSVYWITGKPGSGKSTLMKFVFENPQLEENLQEYAGSLPLMLAGFFFWNPGSEMEKSQEGLVRTLLHQCLEKRPDLIPIVAQKRWALLSLLGSDTIPPDWTWGELKESFHTLCSCHGKEFSLVIFIDGLDEFSEAETSSGTLVDWIKDIVARHHVKLCVSSRPWNVFSDAFCKGPSLTMQTLTKRDIEYFVKAEFETSPAFQDLRDVFGDDAVSLLKEITEKADGVFLWVGLVVKSLLSILVDTPSLPYLYEKLDEIPNDIIGMYTSIWRSIPPERLATASKIFQLRKTSILTLEAEVCWLVTEGVSTADAIKNPKAREGIQKVMKRVLEGHTRGICELSRGNIQFLHRSAAEWMQEKAMWAEICSKAPDDFESNLSLLEATVLHPLANKDYLFRSYSYFAELCFFHLSVMFYHAYSAYASPLCQSDSSRKKRIARALDAMIGMVREDFTELRKDNVSNGDRVVNSTPQSLTVFSTQSWVAVGPPSGWLDLEIFFVGLAAWQGLVDYVKQKVTLDNRLLVAKPNRVSILEQAIFPNVDALRHSRSPANILLVMSGFREERLEIIKFILKMSKIRYQTWNGLPMWHMVEDALASPRISEYDQEKSEWLKKVLVILEEHGYRNNSNSILGQGDRKKTGVWQRFKAKLKPAKDA